MGLSFVSLPAQHTYKLKFGAPPWLPLWGSCRACEAEGVSSVEWYGVSMIARPGSFERYGTPPDLASSATLPKGEGESPTNSNLQPSVIRQLSGERNIDPLPMLGVFRFPPLAAEKENLAALGQLPQHLHGLFHALLVKPRQGVVQDQGRFRSEGLGGREAQR